MADAYRLIALYNVIVQRGARMTCKALSRALYFLASAQLLSAALARQGPGDGDALHDALQSRP